MLTLAKFIFTHLSEKGNWLLAKRLRIPDIAVQYLQKQKTIRSLELQQILLEQSNAGNMKYKDHKSFILIIAETKLSYEKWEMYTHNRDNTL